MPYTSVLPKPLMPIGAKPVLELLVKWLRRNAIEELYITTGYLGHLIRSFCGDGRQWGLHIVYTEETEPLGTIGALTLLEKHLDETFLVLNGDVLTDLSLRTFTGIHRAHGQPFTIATACRSNKLDFGVIEDQDGVVTSFSEKPVLTNSVSMGIYCMEPGIFRSISRGTPFGVDDLANCLPEKGVPIHVFTHPVQRLDIGRVEDFHKARDLSWDGHAPSLIMVVG